MVEYFEKRFTKEYFKVEKVGDYFYDKEKNDNDNNLINEIKDLSAGIINYI